MLKLAKMSDYRAIVKRDFFAAYVAPPASPSRHETAVDPADYAFVTGFTEVDGAAQVWLQDRMAGKPWKLGTGESFVVGKVKGTVQSIHPKGEVIVEFDGHHRLLHVGDNLHGGVEIRDSAPNQPDEGGNSARPVPDPGN